MERERERERETDEKRSDWFRQASWEGKGSRAQVESSRRIRVHVLLGHLGSEEKMYKQLLDGGGGGDSRRTALR